MNEKLNANKAYVVVDGGVADVVYAPKSAWPNIEIVDYDVMNHDEIAEFEAGLELVRFPAAQVERKERKQMETIYDATGENELRRFLLKIYDARTPFGDEGGIVWSSMAADDGRSTSIRIRAWGLTHAELPRLVATGFSRCGPNDVFDLEFGRRVASGRAVAAIAEQLWPIVQTKQLIDSFAEGSHEQ